VDEPGLIAIHDGVRPFVSAEVITACFDEAEQSGAAIPVVPMIDSIREQDTEGMSHPVDRCLYLAVQTPQVFQIDLLKEAYRQPYTPAFTDDASVVEAMGVKIHTVPGNRENIKITDPLDLLMAEALLRKTM
jgi:2-C-methyl-D-erythritol 4-phosphate cytidylyltransferase